MVIKPASLNEEMFVVLTFDLDTVASIIDIQKNISEYYKLNFKANPKSLHITIDRINKNKYKEAKLIIDKILEGFIPFEVFITNFKCFQSNNNFLTLKVDYDNKLKVLSENIHKSLKKNRLSTIDNYDQWQYHITIITDLLDIEIKENINFELLCHIFDNVPHKINLMVKAIEIWSFPDK